MEDKILDKNESSNLKSSSSEDGENIPAVEIGSNGALYNIVEKYGSMPAEESRYIYSSTAQDILSAFLMPKDESIFDSIKSLPFGNTEGSGELLSERSLASPESKQQNVVGAVDALTSAGASTETPPYFAWAFGPDFFPEQQFSKKETGIVSSVIRSGSTAIPLAEDADAPQNFSGNAARNVPQEAGSHTIKLSENKLGHPIVFSDTWALRSTLQDSAEPLASFENSVLASLKQVGVTAVPNSMLGARLGQNWPAANLQSKDTSIRSVYQADGQFRQSDQEPMGGLNSRIPLDHQKAELIRSAELGTLTNPDRLKRDDLHIFLSGQDKSEAEQILGTQAGPKINHQIHAFRKVLPIASPSSEAASKGEPVDITVSDTAESVEIRFGTKNVDTLELLTRHQSELKNDLKRAGIGEYSLEFNRQEDRPSQESPSKTDNEIEGLSSVDTPQPAKLSDRQSGSDGLDLRL